MQRLEMLPRKSNQCVKSCVKVRSCRFGVFGCISGACVPALWLQSGRFWVPAPPGCRYPGSGSRQRPAPAPSAGRWWTWSGCASASASRSVHRGPWRACRELWDKNHDVTHSVGPASLGVRLQCRRMEAKVKLDILSKIRLRLLSRGFAIVLRLWLPANYFPIDNAADLWCG